MTELAQIKSRMQATWSAGDFAVVATMITIVGEELCETVDLHAGQDVLDVATGSGNTAIAAARRFTNVTGVDFVPALLERARERAAVEGLKIDFREGDAEALPLPDESFDVVLSTFGVMFAPDHAKAAAEMLRVLRPGGRISAAVWAGPPGNPWATIPLTAISAEVKLPTPPPDAPGLFRCAAPGAIGGVFRGAGMRDVAETDVHGFLQPASAEQYWTYATEVLAPVVAGLAAADDAARDRIRATVIGKVRTFEQNGQLRLPLHARCIIGTK